MQAVMDYGRYLYMTIPTIKQRDMGGSWNHNMKIITEIRDFCTLDYDPSRINTPWSRLRKGLASDYH